ncbi:hypothetical protein BC937DRAFT_91908 [Endogone sp. FLAS-F59071]|nr:hypothetical protein BC937DRAFT_91908 [Endogone sp. FLAS-F59071]|eukprot:RUS21670.1 hypothetical protein BC937DRAFT_91908 [Endogone sp. FLAS-F59071]
MHNKELDDGVDGKLDSTTKVHGVATGGDVLDTLNENGASEYGGRGGTVTSDLVSLVGDILDEPAE